MERINHSKYEFFNYMQVNEECWIFLPPPYTKEDARPIRSALGMFCQRKKRRFKTWITKDYFLYIKRIR